MKKIVLIFVLTTVLGYSVKAQTTAMDFNKNNCNGTNSHLFEDLDNGQAVVLFYYMPNCGSCPPPAKKIQAMLSNLNVNYPGKVKGYAIPYNNTTKCPNVQTWVTGNSLSLFTPLDSGATQVAYYGGFGMPTVVLVGGSDHRVLFNTQNFTTADTTVMRDSIINLFQGPSAVKQHAAQLQEVNIYPNPVSHELSVEISLNSDTYLKIDI